MWIVWLVVPGIRRVLGLDGYVEADPLSVAPFVLTLLVAALDGRAALSRRSPVVCRDS